MRLKSSIYYWGTLILVFLFPSSALTWNESVTHRDLSRIAGYNSVIGTTNYLSNIGLREGLRQMLKLGNKEQRAYKWIEEGAELEDKSSFGFPVLPGSTTRSFNHFHNPLKPWSQAGLDDWVGLLHYTGESSLIWAQDGTYQQNFPDKDWSWQTVRNHFYNALTATDNSLRQANFARAFRGLGHQMHLVQDAAQPDHVRNDAHPEDAIFGKNPLNGSAYFETWAKEQSSYINSLASNPIFPNVPFNVSYNGLAPITQLYDTDQYDGLNASAGINQGIAEYTNANFFSGDTIFAAERYPTGHRHYFPYPKKASTDLQAYIAQIKPLLVQIAEDGIEDKGIWIKKERDGETVDHFVRASRWSGKIYKTFGEGSLFYSSFYRDDECHKDYASKLIPRAVGYSAGLLDYFFRGNIEITRPDSGVYAQTDNPNTGFTRITLLAKNTTSTGEEMNDGSIELVVKYKLAIDDPFRNYPADYSFRVAPEFSYIVAPEANNIRSIPRSSTVELAFDLSSNPIPLYAIDVYLQVVYKGRLGNEDDAIAIGLKDISEPTPIDILNDMDRICLNGGFYAAGTQEAIAQVDSNHDGIPEWDIYPHDLKDIYGRISPIEVPRYASPAEYNLLVPYINAGYYVRALYVLADYTFNYNFYQTWVKKDPGDAWSHLSLATDIFFGNAIKNQTDYVEDPAACAPLSAPCTIWWYPTFLSYRGAETWWGSGIIYINSTYPANSECSCYEGMLRTCPKQQLSKMGQGSRLSSSAEVIRESPSFGSNAWHIGK